MTLGSLLRLATLLAFPCTLSYDALAIPCSWTGCMPRIRHRRGRQKQLSNVNYEQRDNFQMEIAAVEQANRREQDDFENQVCTCVWRVENTSKGWVGLVPPRK